MLEFCFSKQSICVLQQNFLHQNDRLIVVQLMISVLQVNLYSVELRQFSLAPSTIIWKSCKMRALLVVI